MNDTMDVIAARIDLMEKELADIAHTARLLGQEHMTQTSMYTAQSLIELYHSSVADITPVWVQTESGVIFAAVLDGYGDDLVAVAGCKFAFSIKDYLTKWVAWSGMPSVEQTGSVMWPKGCGKNRQTYMFGDEKHA